MTVRVELQNYAFFKGSDFRLEEGIPIFITEAQWGTIPAEVQERCLAWTVPGTAAPSGASVHIGDDLKMYRNAPFDATSGGFAPGDVTDSQGTTIAFDSSPATVGNWGNPIVRVSEEGLYAIRWSGNLNVTGDGSTAVQSIGLRLFDSGFNPLPFDGASAPGISFNASVSAPSNTVTTRLPAGAFIEVTIPNASHMANITLYIERVA